MFKSGLLVDESFEENSLMKYFFQLINKADSFLEVSDFIAFFKTVIHCIAVDPHKQLPYLFD